MNTVQKEQYEAIKRALPCVTTDDGMGGNFSARITGATDTLLRLPGTGGTLNFNDTSFTFAGWFLLEGIGAGSLNTLINKIETAVQYNIRYNVTIPNALQFTCRLGASNRVVNTGDLGITVDTWHFVRAWWDKAAGTINIQHNDDAINSASFAGSMIATAAQFRMGIQDNPLFRPMDGRMDRWAAWDRVLTPTEHATLYDVGNSIPVNSYTGSLLTNIISGWELDEASGNFVDSYGVNDLERGGTITQSPGVPNV